MMLSRRLPSKGPAPQPGSVSPAQFQTAVESYHPLHQPANRLVKPLLTSDEYSYYENTSRKGRRSNDVTFPPVHRPPIKSYGSPRRSAKRGPRNNLPTMKGQQHRRLPWYHEDGSVNLQALSHLGQHRQSFPRSQSYYERLHKIHTNRSWPQASQHHLLHDENLIPLLLNNDDLTPRRRAERDSFLATLLQADDLTEEELDELAHYFFPDGVAAADSTAMREDSAVKKSPRSKSPGFKGGVQKKKAVKSKGQNTAMSPRQSPRSKSVRFLRASPLPGVSENTSPRPQSAAASYGSDHRPQSSVGHRTSGSSSKPLDPFHVASPRSVDSDDIAYICDVESVPEITASSELISGPKGTSYQPKVTYYDDDGEEIEEEIFQEHNELEGGDLAREKSSKRGSSQRKKSESSRTDSFGGRRLSPVFESGSTPEHMPDLDTPRVNREPESTEPVTRSKSPSRASDDSSRPQGLSDSSESPRQPSASQAQSSSAKREATSQSEEKAPNDDADGDDSQLNSSTPRNVVSPRTPVEPSTEDSSDQSSEKSRPKSAKRARKSSSPQQPDHAEDSNSTSSTRHAKLTKASQRLEKTNDSSRNSNTGNSHREGEDAPPIPVISLTRGQLASVPARSLRITAASTPPNSSKAQPTEGTEASESLRDGDSSPRSSGVARADSGLASSVGSDTTPEKRSRRKDDRMKIWLTRTAWDRQVECAVE